MLTVPALVIDTAAASMVELTVKSGVVLTVKSPSVVALPIAPTSDMSPAPEVNERLFVPSIVSEKVISPPALSIATLPVSVTGC